MTRLVTCGWESGDINEASTAFGGTITRAVVTNTPTPRSPGTYCYKLGGAVSIVNGQSNIMFAAPKTEIWVRVAIYCNTSGQQTEKPFLKFLDASVGVQGTISWNPVDQLVRAYRGDSATVIGTSTFTFPVATWHTCEVRWKVTSTTSSTDGIVEVWIDGTRWINLPAVDSTNTSILNIQGIALNETIGSGSSGTFMAFDDLAINDTNGTINNGQIGEGRVVLLKPTANGAIAPAQTRGGTDTGANWSQVNELPMSMTQYVYASAAGTRDTYALEDIPAGIWTINAVEVLALAQNSDAGLGSLGLTLISGATTNEGAAQSLTISAAYYRQLYETDPNTSAAWTNAAVNALEAGTTVR